MIHRLELYKNDQYECPLRDKWCKCEREIVDPAPESRGQY